MTLYEYTRFVIKINQVLFIRENGAVLFVGEVHFEEILTTHDLRSSFIKKMGDQEIKWARDVEGQGNAGFFIPHGKLNTFWATLTKFCAPFILHEYSAAI